MVHIMGQKSIAKASANLTLQCPAKLLMHKLIYMVVV